ncbi:hypothetical protein M8C21_031978 [Ambrosia artemisiifolia]|uniref:Transmembrane protein n=1 Tax=Ambrosia artemisiifolia TaxID=4212 RepID=A0AAD5D5N7_AMBAR|nr:hypothetical protein M8C21_031978 [Ambrosia artemisiifolia]
MDLKNCLTTVCILFLLLAVPCFSKERPNSEVYDIDYRGPETHSHRPPPNKTGSGFPHSNLKKHPRFKRQATRNATKKGRKA